MKFMGFDYGTDFKTIARQEEQAGNTQFGSTTGTPEMAMTHDGATIYCGVRAYYNYLFVDKAFLGVLFKKEVLVGGVLYIDLSQHDPEQLIPTLIADMNKALGQDAEVGGIDGSSWEQMSELRPETFARYDQIMAAWYFDDGAIALNAEMSKGLIGITYQ